MSRRRDVPSPSGNERALLAATTTTTTATATWRRRGGKVAAGRLVDDDDDDDRGEIGTTAARLPTSNANESEILLAARASSIMVAGRVWLLAAFE